MNLGSFLPIAAFCINVRIGLLCLKQKINRHPPAGDTPSPWESPPAVFWARCTCTDTSHWPVGRHIWEVLVYLHPLCSRLSRHRLPGPMPSGPLICDALGAIFDEVVLKAVPIYASGQSNDLCLAPQTEGKIERWH